MTFLVKMKKKLEYSRFALFLSKIKNLESILTFFDFNFNEHKETYVGLTATEFKDRHRNHKTSLNKKNYSNSTTLREW